MTRFTVEAVIISADRERCAWEVSASVSQVLWTVKAPVKVAELILTVMWNIAELVIIHAKVAKCVQEANVCYPVRKV